MVLKDEYLDKERMTYEKQRAEELFGETVTIIPFEGNHEMNIKLIQGFV